MKTNNNSTSQQKPGTPAGSNTLLESINNSNRVVLYLPADAVIETGVSRAGMITVSLKSDALRNSSGIFFRRECLGIPDPYSLCAVTF